MKQQISSNIGLLFKVLLVVKFIVFTIVFLIVSLIFFDWRVFLIFIVIWLIWFFSLKQMGILKLKKVIRTENELIIGYSDKIKIDLIQIKRIEQTFLFTDFPY